MTKPIPSLEHLGEVYQIEEDFLFENLLAKLNAHRHLILSADQGWGVKEYVNELAFQLSEKYTDIHTCFIDLQSARSSNSFLELFLAAMTQLFPAEISDLNPIYKNKNPLELPAQIAKRKGIRMAVFLGNCHLVYRFHDAVPFLRSVKLKLKNQNNCVYCLYGNINPGFQKLAHYPGPLSGLGQQFHLRHNPYLHRSASVRKLFHDHHKSIGYRTSIQMSYAVDNHPFFLKLLCWHSLINTERTCTSRIVEKALLDLILHYDHHFNQLMENLTHKQISFLKALVEGHTKLHSNAVRTDYRLGPTGNVSKIINCLRTKGIIDKRMKICSFTNPIFREWLRRYYFSNSTSR
jgi:hypothetical protein